MGNRLLSLLLAALIVHCCTLLPVLPALAEACPAEIAQSSPGAIAEDANTVSVPSPKAPVYFASGAVYDSEKHHWKDRYSGKSIDLGLPGVAGRYGLKDVIADNTVIAAGPGGGATTGSTSGFPYKNIFIITLLGLGTATAITLPIALHHHNHHHQQLIWQRNQIAAYYFFHNQTLPIPKLILPPPPPLEHSSPPPPPPGN